MTDEMSQPQDVFVDPTAYADEGRLKSALAWLRANDPVPYVDSEVYGSFWALTRYADVMEATMRRDVFHNAPSPQLTPLAARRKQDSSRLRSLIHMDGPEHATHRAITSEWFLPKSVNRYEAQITSLATRFVDQFLDAGGGDFVAAVAEQLPLHTILAILGLPEADQELVL